MTDRRRTLVVAGLIVGDDGRILITQRRPEQALGGKWEFPGGKVEPGEAPVAALARELAEEIGVTVAVGRIWDVLFHAYPEFDLVMLVYVCRIVTGSGGPGGPGGPGGLEGLGGPEGPGGPEGLGGSLAASGGAPRAVEVADLAWVAPGDLGKWDILPADRPLVERLRVEGVPPN